MFECSIWTTDGRVSLPPSDENALIDLLRSRSTAFEIDINLHLSDQPSTGRPRPSFELSVYWINGDRLEARGPGDLNALLSWIHLLFLPTRRTRGPTR